MSQELNSYEDISRVRDELGVTAVMIARAAQKNVSIFRKEGLLEMHEVIKKILKLSVDYDNSDTNTKYVIQVSPK